MTCSVLLRIGDAPQGVCHGHDRGEHYHNPDDPEDRFHHRSRYKSVSRCGLVAASPPNAQVQLRRLVPRGGAPLAPWYATRRVVHNDA